MKTIKFGGKQTMAEKVKVASANKAATAKDKKPAPKPKVSIGGTNPIKKKVAVKVTIPIQRGK